MKKLFLTALCSAALAFLPVVAFAQVVNTSASVQQSFLSELQSLQQQLAALEATIDAMIVAAGGSLPSSSSGATSNSSPSVGLPHVQTTLFPTSNLSGDMLTSSLLQAITPASTTVFVISQATTSAGTSNSGTASPQNIATQLDPSCNSGLWANGAQCNGLYYCGVGVAGGYWSSSACHLAE